MRSGVDRVAGQRWRAAKHMLDVQGDISAGSAKWWRSIGCVMDQECCRSPARAVDRGSARESRAMGTGRRTGVANLGVSAGAWAGDGRRGSPSESQIRDESGAAGDSEWAGDSGGKEENGAAFLETRCGSCFSRNRRTRVFVVAHKRVVTKRRSKHSLFGHAFAFLGKKSDKNQNQTGPRSDDQISIRCVHASLMFYFLCLKCLS
jgi:hypothetical protein